MWSRKFVPKWIVGQEARSATTLPALHHADLHQAMGKAMVAAGLPPQMGPTSPYTFAQGAAVEAATLRAQVQQLQAELATVRAAKGHRSEILDT
jgi:hypothetical protein